VFAGTLDLQGADIRGSVHLASLRCTDPGPDGALHLSRAVIGGGLLAPRADLTGLVQLRHARVSASVDLADATVAGTVEADNLVLSGDLDFTGATVTGAVTLRGAQVDGTVDLRDMVLGAREGISVHADGLVCFQLVLMCRTPPGDIDVSHASVDVLCDVAPAWPTGPGRPRLTDFTYRQLRKDVPVAERLDILLRASPTVQPQPYEQLAAVYRSAGRDRLARRVLREKLRRESRTGGWPQRAWGLVQDTTIGYGYLPGRAALIFATLLVAGTSYYATAADCAGRPGLCPVDPAQHPRWDPLLYVLDLLVPLVDLGHEKSWDPSGVDKAVMIGLLLSGWIFATTLIAAAGRALNRP
jgi:hypothetical protein